MTLSRPYSLATTLGVVYPFVVSLLCFDMWLMVLLGGSFVVMVAVGWFFGRRVSPRWPLALCVLTGIVGGVMSRVVYDDLMQHPPHNLFPLEIVEMAVLTQPGLIAGFGLAWFLNRRSRRLKNRAPLAHRSAMAPRHCEA